MDIFIKSKSVFFFDLENFFFSLWLDPRCFLGNQGYQTQILSRSKFKLGQSRGSTVIFIGKKSMWVFLAVGKQQIGAFPPPTDAECRS